MEQNNDEQQQVSEDWKIKAKEELKEWLNDSGFSMDEEGYWVNDDGDNPELVLQDLIDFYGYGYSSTQSELSKLKEENKRYKGALHKIKTLSDNNYNEVSNKMSKINSTARKALNPNI